MDSFSTLNTLASTSVYAVGTGFAMHLLDSFLPAPQDPSKVSVLSSGASIALQSMANMYALGILLDFRTRFGLSGNLQAEVTLPVVAAILIAAQPNFSRKLHNFYRHGVDTWTRGFKMTVPGYEAAPMAAPKSQSNIQTVERNTNIGSDAPVIGFF
jgi:hypothetical protein